MTEAAPTVPDFADIVAVLSKHAIERGDQIALRFLRRGETVEEETTYAELDIAARIVARNLTATGLAGRPVLISLPQGLDFVRCFLGCLYAGAIAVPTPALGDPRGAERIARIVDHARPAALIGAAERHTAASWAALQEAAPDLYFVAGHDIVSGAPDAALPARPETEIAFLQYTSGSTSRPKGVVITRRNIAANLAMIQTAFGQDSGNSTVSWLPMHHDMGLIGCVLEPLNIGATATLMSPLAFLQKPIRWLRAMDRFAATTAGAPNFAYDLCVRTIDTAQAQRLDLTRWSLAFCGSEPVRADTLARFAETFAVSGFPASALYPCYGLAEATLFVTGGAAGSGLQTAELPRDGGGKTRAVSCGYPRLGSAIALLDPGGTAQIESAAIGEICVAGDQVSPGFWHADGGVLPDPARETTIGDRRYLRTGDIGSVRDGALYVLGRSKHMIIVRGANIYAEDVEQTVLRHPAAAAFGAVAALTVLERPDEDDTIEGMIVVCELSRGASLPEKDPLPALTEALSEAHGMLPFEMLVVPNGSLERTVSGKLQREATRFRLSEGSLSVLRYHKPRRIAKTRPDISSPDDPRARGHS